MRRNPQLCFLNAKPASVMTAPSFSCDRHLSACRGYTAEDEVTDIVCCQQKWLVLTPFKKSLEKKEAGKA
jgi:hypothetical protein